MIYFDDGSRVITCNGGYVYVRREAIQHNSSLPTILTTTTYMFLIIKIGQIFFDNIYAC